MRDLQQLYYLPPPPLPKPAPPPPPLPSSHGELPPPASPHKEPSPPPSQPTRFDPSRMVGIIRRKALIKDLAALYHAECLTYCQELLEHQRKLEESYAGLKIPEKSKKETWRPAKRRKKSR